jgi:endothelin-converting enzyme/putative endopeptidase
MLILKNDDKLKMLYKQLYINNNNNNVVMILKLFIDYIVSSKNKCKLYERIIKLDLSIGINNIINYYVNSDYNNSNMNILHLTSGGLGLPDRDYYFLEDKKHIREEYIRFIDRYIKHINKYYPITVNAHTIFNIEKKLAEKTYTMVESRDPKKLNNVILYDNFIRMYPNLSFINIIFNKANVTPEKINITNPEYFKMVNILIDTISLEDMKQYYIFRLVTIEPYFSNFLDNDIMMCHFNFYKKLIYGVDKILPRWKRSLDILNNIIGEKIGELYIKNYFSQESKKIVESMVMYIKDELQYYLSTNNILEEVTKIRAIEKLNKMGLKIGYPDKYTKDYSKLLDSNNIHSMNPLIVNMLNIKQFNTKYELRQLYKPLDRNEWHMYPHDINAYYSPERNEIVFPAGILQAPFFSLKQSMAENFGGIGVIIGHEIIHGFDDEGCMYDGDGNIKNWWTEKDLKNYKDNTKKVVEQYNKYDMHGVNLNGNLTLGENIADIGGMTLSYKAYLKYVKNDTFDNKKFFINFANIWKNKSRKEYSMHNIVKDPHSPPIWRVNGTLSNSNFFYELFNIKPGDKLYLDKDKRANIWGSNE